MGYGIDLYLDVDTGNITLEDGSLISMEAAEKLWNQCKFDDCNLAFRRLACNDFDIDKTREDYRIMESLTQGAVDKAWDNS